MCCSYRCGGWEPCVVFRACSDGADDIHVRDSRNERTPPFSFWILGGVNPRCGASFRVERWKLGTSFRSGLVEWS
jgi:hypothetical protein